MKTIWTETAALPSAPVLNEHKNTDVLIIGGGMAGLLCACLLEQAGKKCIVLEANRIARGVSAGTTAKITAQHGLGYIKLVKQFGPKNAALYLEANLQAVEHFERLAQNIDCDFQRTASALFTRSHVESLQREQQVLKSLGFSTALIVPQNLPFPVAGALEMKNQACFHPLKFAAGLLDALEIYERSAVQRIQSQTAYTLQGSVTAKQIIFATHFPIVGRHGLYPLKLYQHRSYVLALENAPMPTQMLLEIGGDGLSFRTYQNYLLLGGCGHRTGTDCGLDKLKDIAKMLYPKAHIRYAWGTQDCMSLDSMPYIGRYGGSNDWYVATGFNKWGMTGSMAAAEVLCDLLCKRQNKYASLFDPARSMWTKQLAVNIGQSVKGLLTPRVPRCTHLGCALKYNSQEHSWDCSCHGSRFSENGAVLNTPAVRKLK